MAQRLAWWALLWLATAVGAEAFPLRVLVGGPQPRITIAVSVPARLQQAEGQMLEIRPGRPMIIDAQHLGKLTLPVDGLVLVGDRWYPESMVFGWLNGGVVAINCLDSENYLRGVIPREMPENYSYRH